MWDDVDQLLALSELLLFSVYAESRFKFLTWNPVFVFRLVEPFYGTICLYNRERREKLSEDSYLRVLPAEMQDVSRARPILTYFLGFFLMHEISG